ncbi:uncharacterized protein GGS25DRAFT_519978 [Hypoxylon fragiforme]|uniref:uncharacterized protein n=1 Tax=Hypoxylon fragiforme TaxID=63214 RepID=UPI0020C683A7|nr:uncharacterized protein GGS25DRAFT_519978 [Hypoxylon fragiforme]KAI2611666.1 hypothetical protein GGS25DRAFT_519978 [Hypoxylon fragiforme]
MDETVFSLGPGALDQSSPTPIGWYGSHRQKTLFGPHWLLPSFEPCFPYRTMVDLLKPLSPDVSLYNIGPPIHMTEQNTMWVYVNDGRIVYVPRWKDFRVLTLPANVPAAREFYNSGRLAPGDTGMWVVFTQGMYWLPPESPLDLVATLTAKQNGLVFVDGWGTPYTHPPGDNTDCLMTFSPGTTWMVLESGSYGKGALKVPDARVLVFLSGAMQSRDRPPFRVWNVLRAAGAVIDGAYEANRRNLLEYDPLFGDGYFEVLDEHGHFVEVNVSLESEDYTLEHHDYGDDDGGDGGEGGEGGGEGGGDQGGDQGGLGGLGGLGDLRGPENGNGNGNGDEHGYGDWGNPTVENGGGQNGRNEHDEQNGYNEHNGLDGHDGYDEQNRHGGLNGQSGLNGGQNGLNGHNGYTEAFEEYLDPQDPYTRNPGGMARNILYRERPDRRPFRVTVTYELRQLARFIGAAAYDPPDLID